MPAFIQKCTIFLGHQYNLRSSASSTCWNKMIDLFRQNPSTKALYNLINTGTRPFFVLVLCTIRIYVCWVGTSEMCSPPAIQGQLNHWALWVYIPSNYRHHSLSPVMHWLPINHRHIEIDQSSNNLSKQSRIYPHSLPNKHRSQSWQIKQLFTFVSAYFVIQKHPFIAKWNPKISTRLWPIIPENRMN